MDACCCLSEDADFFYECYSEKMVVGKRDYYCWECNRLIPKGEQHQVAKGVHERKWAEYRTCLGCVRLIEEYGCGGRVFGRLAEDIYDCFGTWIVDGEEFDDEEDD